MFKLGAELVAGLSEFRAKLRRLDALEGREHPRDPTGVLASAIDIVRLHASFERIAHEGKSSLGTRGRPAVPARGRVAARYAKGWTDMHDGTTWIPTARDLALLAICEGADELPSGWKDMTIAELLDAEERAMRPYRTGKK